MKAIHLLAVAGAMFAPAVCAASGADAQVTRAGIVPIANGGGGARIIPLSNGGHFQSRGRHMHGGHDRRGRRGFHGLGGIWIVEREVPVIVEREVVREVLVPVVPEPPPPPRKPYVIGRSYASLPGGCMKMIEGGASYYYCGGEWYRQVGKQYRAVAKP